MYEILMLFLQLFYFQLEYLQEIFPSKFCYFSFYKLHVLNVSCNICILHMHGVERGGLKQSLKNSVLYVRNLESIHRTKRKCTCFQSCGFSECDYTINCIFTRVILY